jgi:hypothetical protein
MRTLKLYHIKILIMKQLFFTGLCLLFISQITSAQMQKSTEKKSKTVVLPTKQQWQVASKAKAANSMKANSTASAAKSKDANKLPTKAQWGKAAMLTRRSKIVR